MRLKGGEASGMRLKGRGDFRNSLPSKDQRLNIYNFIEGLKNSHLYTSGGTGTVLKENYVEAMEMHTTRNLCP
jgi:hypothetical protein